MSTGTSLVTVYQHLRVSMTWIGKRWMMKALMQYWFLSIHFGDDYNNNLINIV
jgi:hypothetical protein